ASGPSTLSQEMFKPFDTPFFFELSEEGQGNPLTTFDVDPAVNKKTWREFPPNYEIVTDIEIKPSTIPLVYAYTDPEGQRYPAIAYHSYGKGTAVYMGFDSTWRWRKEFGDRYFRDYWGKVAQFLGLAHLLGESAQARVFLDRLVAGIGDRVLITGSIRNRDYSPYVADSVEVTVINEQGKKKDIELTSVKNRPGLFRTTFYPEEEGKLQFALPPKFESEPSELVVKKVSREYQNSGVKTPVLNAIADRTKGYVFTEFLDDYNPTNAVTDASGEVVQPVRQNVWQRVWGRIFGGNKDGGERLRRIADLRAMRESIAYSEKNPFEDKSFIKRASAHVLSTIREMRPKLPLSVDMDLWDYFGLLILTCVILCVEYTFRKLWYLD
ncbi:hypothetical protein BVX97_05765, partial [bacterium E08(2017)]